MVAGVEAAVVATVVADVVDGHAKRTALPIRPPEREIKAVRSHHSKRSTTGRRRFEEHQVRRYYYYYYLTLRFQWKYQTR